LRVDIVGFYGREVELADSVLGDVVHGHEDAGAELDAAEGEVVGRVDRAAAADVGGALEDRDVEWDGRVRSVLVEGVRRRRASGSGT
jgi:hypothetical protein